MGILNGLKIDTVLSTKDTLCKIGPVKQNRLQNWVKWVLYVRYQADSTFEKDTGEKMLTTERGNRQTYWYNIFRIC